LATTKTFSPLPAPQKHHKRHGVLAREADPLPGRKEGRLKKKKQQNNKSWQKMRWTWVERVGKLHCNTDKLLFYLTEKKRDPPHPPTFLQPPRTQSEMVVMVLRVQ
jgi:hypothetical protein